MLSGEDIQTGVQPTVETIETEEEILKESGVEAQTSKKLTLEKAGPAEPLLREKLASGFTKLPWWARLFTVRAKKTNESALSVPGTEVLTLKEESVPEAAPTETLPLPETQLTIMPVSEGVSITPPPETLPSVSPALTPGDVRAIISEELSRAQADIRRLVHTELVQQQQNVRQTTLTLTQEVVESAYTSKVEKFKLEIDEANSKSSQPKIVVIVPAYNEERFIGSLVLKTLMRYPVTVIVVDDGSTDDTPRIAKSAGVVLVEQKQNLGKGTAINAGLAKAREYMPELNIPTIQWFIYSSRT